DAATSAIGTSFRSALAGPCLEACLSFGLPVSASAVVWQESVFATRSATACASTDAACATVGTLGLFASVAADAIFVGACGPLAGTAAPLALVLPFACAMPIACFAD